MGRGATNQHSRPLVGGAWLQVHRFDSERLLAVLVRRHRTWTMTPRRKRKMSFGVVGWWKRIIDESSARRVDSS